LESLRFSMVSFCFLLFNEMRENLPHSGGGLPVHPIGCVARLAMVLNFLLTAGRLLRSLNQAFVTKSTALLLALAKSSSFVVVLSHLLPTL